MKNWRIVLLASGIIIGGVNYVLGLLFPFGWKYIKCPPLSCDFREPYGYGSNFLYFVIGGLTILLIVFGTTFLLARLVSQKFYRKNKTI